MLDSVKKRILPLQPRFLPLLPPAFPAVTTHTLETFLLPTRLPTAGLISLRKAPLALADAATASSKAIDDILPGRRPVYGTGALNRPPVLPIPYINVSLCRPPGPMNPGFAPPFDLSPALPFPSLLTTPWLWMHNDAHADAMALLKTPLELAPIHFDPARVTLARTPAAHAAASGGKKAPPVKFDVNKPATHNSTLGQSVFLSGFAVLGSCTSLQSCCIC